MEWQAKTLKMGIELAGCWANPGEVSPPNGIPPQEMRRQAHQIINHLQGEILLTVFYVLLMLFTLAPDNERVN